MVIIGTEDGKEAEEVEPRADLGLHGAQGSQIEVQTGEYIHCVP